MGLSLASRHRLKGSLVYDTTTTLSSNPAAVRAQHCQAHLIQEEAEAPRVEVLAQGLKAGRVQSWKASPHLQRRPFCHSTQPCSGRQSRGKGWAQPAYSPSPRLIKPQEITDNNKVRVY